MVGQIGNTFLNHFNFMVLESDFIENIKPAIANKNAGGLGYPMTLYMEYRLMAIVMQPTARTA